MEKENNILNNLPKFYIGQRIVAIHNHIDGMFKKGDEFIVKGIRKGHCYFIIDIGMTSENKTTTCICGFVALKDSNIYWFNENRFAPLQQSSFPLMTFKEIVKKEEKEVLILN